MNFDLQKPCKDCPFIKGTSMVLRPGRMASISRDLKNDYSVFPCHKTTHRREENEDGSYAFSGQEQACMGSLAYTLKTHGHIPVLARLAIGRGEVTLAQIEGNIDCIEEKGKWSTS